MVIHSIIGEYDILYAQEREAAYALSSDKGTEEMLINTFFPFCKMSSKTQTRTFFKMAKRKLRFNQRFPNGYDEALFSADCTKLSAETLRLPCDVGSLKSFSVLNK